MRIAFSISPNFLRLSSFILALGLIDSGANEPEPDLPFHPVNPTGGLEFTFNADWESRYYLEGRDTLNGDGLLTSTIEASFHDFGLGFWYGSSPGQNYDEIQISPSVSHSFGDLDVYVAYTHLRFPFENAHDNEVGAGVALNGLPLGLAASVDAYHSFDADGTFLQAALGGEYQCLDRLMLMPEIVFGANQGYIPDGHDGANHFAFRLGAHYALTESLSLTAHATYSLALNRDPFAAGDQQLLDFFHAGVGVQLTF